MPAHNVLNTAEVDQLVDDLARLTDRPALDGWVRGPVRRWLLRDYPEHDPVGLDPDTDEPALFDSDEYEFVALPESCQPKPDWLVPALARGDDVVVLRLDEILLDRIVAVIAFLEADERFARRGALDRLSFVVAERKSETARTGVPTLPDGDATVFRFDDGAEIVRLNSADALQREGERMHHCIGGYRESVQRGRCLIFSLRDGSRRPAATIEIDRKGRVEQVRGFGNRPIKARDQARLQVFLNARGYRSEQTLQGLSELVAQMSRTGVDLDAAIQSPAGGAFLCRNAWMVGRYMLDRHACWLIDAIADCAWELSPSARRAIFEGLLPNPPFLRLRGAGGIWVYDNFLPVYQVALPLVLINLWRCGLFDGLGVDRQAREVQTAAEGELVLLAFTPADCLFDLGQPCQMPAFFAYAEFGIGSPADLLLASRIDISGPRLRRHDAIRQRLNADRRRSRSRRGPPNEGHIVVKDYLNDVDQRYII